MVKVHIQSPSRCKHLLTVSRGSGSSLLRSTLAQLDSKTRPHPTELHIFDSRRLRNQRKCNAIVPFLVRSSQVKLEKVRGCKRKPELTISSCLGTGRARQSNADVNPLHWYTRTLPPAVEIGIELELGQPQPTVTESSSSAPMEQERPRTREQSGSPWHERQARSLMLPGQVLPKKKPERQPSQWQVRIQTGGPLAKELVRIRSACAGHSQGVSKKNNVRPPSQ